MLVLERRRQEQDDMDRLKGLSSLQVKGKDLVQAGLAFRQVIPVCITFAIARFILPLPVLGLSSMERGVRIEDLSADY